LVTNPSNTPTRPLGYLGQLPHPCFDSGNTDARR